MKDYQIETKIYQSIEENGLMQTIGKHFGAGAKIELPFTQKECETEILSLSLSVRSTNCLMRAGLRTVGKVLEAMEKNALWGIRNLGKKSRAEIHVCMYEFGYNSLTEQGRKNFAKRLYQLNKEMYKDIV